MEPVAKLVRGLVTQDPGLIWILEICISLLFFAGVGFGQSSSDGMFVVQNVNRSGSLLSGAQLRQAEELYQSACGIVKRDFRATTDLRPRFTVIIGTDHNEVHGRSEIWLKQWNPALFTEGVVVLAFEEVLTPDAIKQMGERAVRYTDSSVDMADFRKDH